MALAGNVHANSKQLLATTSQWLDSHPELSIVGLPATPTVREEFKQHLDTHIGELSKLRADFASKSKRRWLDWNDSDVLIKIHSYNRYYDHLGELLKLILARPTLVGMMNESRRDEAGIALRLWNLWDEWKSQRYRTRDSRSVQRYVHLFDNRGPTMRDFSEYRADLMNAIRGHGTSKQVLGDLIDRYEANDKELRNLAKNVPGKLWFHYLYGVKSSLLTFFGRFALPDDNVISAEKMATLKDRLVPGDIMVVNQDGRLSNVVFTGTWSHGILYVGSPNQLSEYFANDLDTNHFYEQKCLSEGLECRSFEGFLQLKYEKETREYFASRNDKTPKVIIEGIDKGVLTNSFESMKPVNRMAAFSPKLSALERARAIEIAFSNMGKPYDYNFDTRSYDKLVCTELIMYAYLPEAQTNKKGLDFVISVVRGIPAMYAYNIVEAFFTKGELEFKAYWESPRKGHELEERTSEQLAETI